MFKLASGIKIKGFVLEYAHIKGISCGICSHCKNVEIKLWSFNCWELRSMFIY